MSHLYFEIYPNKNLKRKWTKIDLKFEVNFALFCFQQSSGVMWSWIFRSNGKIKSEDVRDKKLEIIQLHFLSSNVEFRFKYLQGIITKHLASEMPSLSLPQHRTKNFWKTIEDPVPTFASIFNIQHQLNQKCRWDRDELVIRRK